MYLFEREEIPIEVVEYVSAVANDRNTGLEAGRKGTSAFALAFLASWANNVVAPQGMPIRCEALAGEDVSAREGSPLVRGLESGAVAVAGCWIGVDHYVLITGLDEDRVYLFDPYYFTWSMHDLGVEFVGVASDDAHPFAYNRVVERWVLDAPAGTPYSFAARSGRDAVLMWRTDKR